MIISAPVAVRHVVEEYQRFLRTSFCFLDPHLREQFEEHLLGMDVLVRGPYITLAQAFSVLIMGISSIPMSRRTTWARMHS